METFKLIYPADEDHYLKEIISCTEKDSQVSIGSALLKKGQLLPMKTLPNHEVSLLVSGQLKVYNNEGEVMIMNAGDFIYISGDEQRETEVLEESKLIYFLFQGA